MWSAYSGVRGPAPAPSPRPILTLPVTVLTWPNKLSSRASLNALLTLAKVHLCAGGCRHVRSKQNTASVKHQPNVKQCWVDAELLNRYSNKLFFHNYSKYVIYLILLLRIPINIITCIQTGVWLTLSNRRLVFIE